MIFVPVPNTMFLDPKILSLQEYLKLVGTELDSNDFKIVSLAESPLGRVGFLGDHFSIKIEVQRTQPENDDGKIEILSFFAKSLPKNQKFRKIVQELRCFEKELYFYEVLSKDFSCTGSHIKLYPKCYIPKQDMVILEDLRDYGFTPIAKTQGEIDLEHIKVVRMHIKLY